MKHWIDNPVHSVGLHFDGHQLHGIHLQFNDDGAEIMAAHTVDCSGIPSDPEAVSALQNLMETLQAPKGIPLHITHHFNPFYTSHISIGEAPLVQMNKMAWMAYQQEINLEGDTAIFDYERVGINEEAVNPKVTLHAFSVEREQVDALTELVQTAGFKVTSLFPLLFAYRNLLTSQSAWKAPTALLILNDKELRIGVVHHHKFIFTRTFKSGLGAFLEYISQKVESPVDATVLAEALDETFDTYHAQLAVEIREAFTYIAERMQLQIDRAFKFYSGRLKLPPVERILLTAGSPAIAQELAQQMDPNYSFSVLPLETCHLEGLDSGVIFLLNNDESVYMLALGAALAQQEHCPNLLFTHAIQQHQRRTYRIRTALMLTLTTLALICGSTFAVQLFLLTPRLIKKRALSRQSAQHESILTKEIMEAKSLLSIKRLNDLHKLAKHYSLQGYYFEIASIIPDSLKLEYLQMRVYTEEERIEKETDAIGNLEMQGIVITRGLRQQAFLTKFLVELGSSPVFRNIRKESFAPEEREAYAELGLMPFRIKCELIYGPSMLPEGIKQ